MSVSEFDEPNTCPRCGGAISTNMLFGATSRWDGLTEICVMCSTGEQVVQWLAEELGQDVCAAIDPVDGRFPWVNPPKNATPVFLI